MIGNVSGDKNNLGTDWGERLLNTVANNTISHLFTESESIEVKISCIPSGKILQGSIDSFSMKGKGLVIRRQFRSEEMSVETDAVSIDFSSVLKGKLKLRQTTQAVAKVILAQKDINESFKAELVTKRLENLTIPSLLELSGGLPVSFTDIWVELLRDNEVKILAKANLGNKIVPIGLIATLTVEKRRKVIFKSPKFVADHIPESMVTLSEIVTQIFVEILDGMVDLDQFDLDGMILRINRLTTEDKKLIFSGYAQIEKIPNT